jgi:hypothetical protein
LLAPSHTQETTNIIHHHRHHRYVTMEKVPPQSPLGDIPAAEVVAPRLAVVEDPSEALKTKEEIEEEIQAKEARSRATVCEHLVNQH